MVQIRTTLTGMLFGLFFQILLSVDKKIFKTCVQSGFCNRNRVVAEHILNGGLSMPWVIEGIEVLGSHLDFKLKRQFQHLAASLKFLSNGALNLKIESIPFSLRYSIPKNDVIFNDTASATNFFRPSTEENIFTIEGTSLAVKITKDPFSMIIISETDGEILKLNSKNLFNFENGREFNISEIVETIDESKNTKLWAEPKFPGKFQDSRTKGPMSFGLDISFSKSRAVYGIPEHASSLALKSTRLIDDVSKTVFTKVDPYRLFNLDVFEYELDSTMALYGAIPIMIGHNPQGFEHKSVGVFWNNPSETWVDIFEDNQAGEKLTHWISESGSFSMFIFAGKNLKEIQRTIKELTGAPQLPPDFALGYHQCRWNYNSVDDVLDVQENFDKHSLPVDVIWLDIEHTDGKKYMTWHPSNFANPERMTSELSRTGRKLVTIVDPHIKKDENWEVYREINEKNLAVKSKDDKSDFEGDCWPGKSVWTDYTNPEARKWWASLFSLDKYQSSTEDLYIWNDMNEPSVFNSPEITMPRENSHHGGVEHRDVHNIYGMYQQMSTFKGLKDRSYGRKRPFLLSRSFYAGSQRFGAVWTGDNKADWGHLKASGSMLMSLGIVGYHFAGADVGGFFGNPSTELLVRWYQTGAMQPFFRAHAHIDTKRREPWLFGDDITSQIRKALRLRYSLLPVWYTAMEESSRTGVPPMRPMIVEFPNDMSFLKVDDQWMVSSSLLFKPITSAGQINSNVLLPKEAIWYNYFDWSIVINRTGVITEAIENIDKMLLYIRGGSIFARKDVARRSSKSMKFDAFSIIVAMNADGYASGSLYVDDGDSYDYEEKDAFSRIQFNARIENGSNILSLDLNVTGETSFLSKNMLQANRLILIQPSGHQVLKISLYLGESKSYQYGLNKIKIT